MIIIGVDYHPSMQQIAFVDTETGDCGEQQLNHSTGEAEKFYRDLKQKGVRVRVGMEATGHARWFERLMAELGFELWIGDPAEIKAARVRKQKTDRQDAQLLLKLLLENRFPRLWVPNPENRDLRQLLWHRHRLVQMRTRVMNQLQAIAMNEGVRLRKALWSKSGRARLESLQLASWATRRRQDLLELLDRLTAKMEPLSVAIEQEALKRPEARRLMTHPGVGPVTALAFVLIIGTPERFRPWQAARQLPGPPFPARTPVPVVSGWGTAVSKAIRCCASCWWKQLTRPYVMTRSGNDGTYIWPCVGKSALPR
jgi:transposase